MGIRPGFLVSGEGRVLRNGGRLSRAIAAARDRDLLALQGLEALNVADARVLRDSSQT